jgi:LuxR family maltose regulon positive regulatory protein
VETPILKTKINIPPARENVLQRHAIYNRLDASVNKNLILVSAPAGYGKTTLLSEWARRKKRRLAWVSLDGYDNDLGRFLSHIVAALQTILPEVGKLTLATLQSAAQASPVSALSVLINEIENVQGERAERLVLVLDDYHVIETQEIHAVMDYLLDNLPAQLQVVISSRAEPALAVSRLRARHQLAEFHANDLRFTPDEASKFLTQSMVLALPPETIAALEARMEGWVAGLQLAALSIQERGGSQPGFFDALSGSHRRILDYLMGEILARQPETTRVFLFQTSILDYLTGELCDAVCDLSPQGSGQDNLETLERMNLFVVRMDDEGRWYRYHRIFADVLSARLKLVVCQN